MVQDIKKRKSESWDDDTPEMAQHKVTKITVPPASRKQTNAFLGNTVSYAHLAKLQKKATVRKVESFSDIPNKSIGESTPATFSTTKSFTAESQASLKQETPITLSAEQQMVLDRVKSGRSIFFTGKAGTGKSFLLKKLIERPPVVKSDLAVTASTGLAAYQINGVTLHSFAGVGLAQAPIQDLIRMINRNKQTMNRWKNTRLLIIDEVSMIESEFFDKLEEIARRVRGNEKPFGGIQIVLCGDFLQLPPVGAKNKVTKFVFESRAWQQLDLEIIQLKQVYRQKDRKLLDILNEMRIGRLSQSSISEISKLSRDLKLVNLKATHLYSLRAQVDAHNKRELGALPGESKIFRARDFCKDERETKKLNESLLCPEVLELRVGAQVMVVKNLRGSQLFNGSIGKVDSFYENEADRSMDGVYVTFEFGSEAKTILIQRESFELEKPGQGVYASRHQLPLVLAYAMSIHKSQGQTLKFVHVDLKSVFEKGQAYVALSRCTSMDGLVIKNFDPRNVQAHPKAIEFHRKHNII